MYHFQHLVLSFEVVCFAQNFSVNSVTFVFLWGKKIIVLLAGAQGERLLKSVMKEVKKRKGTRNVLIFWKYKVKTTTTKTNLIDVAFINAH